MLDKDYGFIKIKLGDYIKKHNIKKGDLAFAARMERTQLNKWIKGEISYTDLHVLARLCKALDCKVEDILEFIDSDTDK